MIAITFLFMVDVLIVLMIFIESRCDSLNFCCFCMLVCFGDVQVNPGPAANSIQDAFSTVKSSGKNGITIGHTNVRGLYTNSAQVKLLDFNTNLDVLAISETHLSPALKDHEIAIQGYQILRRDRIGRTGSGVVIYYSQYSKSKREAKTLK